MYMGFLDLFVATAWDIYFVFGRQSAYYLFPDRLKNDIIMYIGGFITFQNYEIPNLTDLSKELSQIDINLPNFSFCEEKDRFVSKHTALLKEKLVKINK